MHEKHLRTIGLPYERWSILKRKSKISETRNKEVIRFTRRFHEKALQDPYEAKVCHAEKGNDCIIVDIPAQYGLGEVLKDSKTLRVQNLKLADIRGIRRSLSLDGMNFLRSIK